MAQWVQTSMCVCMCCCCYVRCVWGHTRYDSYKKDHFYSGFFLPIFALGPGIKFRLPALHTKYFGPLSQLTRPQRTMSSKKSVSFPLPQSKHYLQTI